MYLALYSNLIKVGMTSEKRFKERITEQGADAAAEIFVCRNRLEARTLEKEISARFKIPQEIKPGALMKQWVTAIHAADAECIQHIFTEDKHLEKTAE